MEGGNPQMRVIENIRDIPAGLKGCVVALGNFDGFHIGHQVIVGESGRLAREMDVPLVVVTTEPHPRSFFLPDQPAFRLTPGPERLRLLAGFGIDAILSLPFDQGLANLSAQDFVLGILGEALGAVTVIVGYDYRFGKDRGGGVSMLRWMGVKEGFGVAVVDPVTIASGSEAYSSSMIRRLLADENLCEATRQMGHWWQITGAVQMGDQRGRTIGFPTANITLGEYLVPAMGVYAVRAMIDGHDEEGIGGVANIGRRPTFATDDILLEVHLPGFEGDLYGRTIGVELVEFIRPEEKFESIKALKNQIMHDCDGARQILSDPKYDRDLYSGPSLDKYLDANPAPPSMRW